MNHDQLKTYVDTRIELIELIKPFVESKLRKIYSTSASTKQVDKYTEMIFNTLDSNALMGLFFQKKIEEENEEK